MVLTTLSAPVCGNCEAFAADVARVAATVGDATFGCIAGVTADFASLVCDATIGRAAGVVVDVVGVTGTSTA